MSIISFAASTYCEPNRPQNNRDFGTYGESFHPYTIVQLWKNKTCIFQEKIDAHQWVIKRNVEKTG
jgi:hypothetical protein